MKTCYASFFLLVLIVYSVSAYCNQAQTPKKVLILGTSYVLNSDGGVQNSIAHSLQTQFDLIDSENRFKFINGGMPGNSLNSIVNDAQIKIEETKPEHTILITGLSSEIVRDCASTGFFLFDICPLHKVVKARPNSALEFIDPYVQAIRKLQTAAHKENSKFIVVFLSGQIKTSHFRSEYPRCARFLKFFEPLGISTDIIVQLLIDSNLNVISTPSFPQIVLKNGGISLKGEFTKMANVKLAEKMTFWLFPELTK